jgi:hypothetical protein
MAMKKIQIPNGNKICFFIKRKKLLPDKGTKWISEHQTDFYPVSSQFP